MSFDEFEELALVFPEEVSEEPPYDDDEFGWCEYEEYGSYLEEIFEEDSESDLWDDWNDPGFNTWPTG